MNQQTKAQKIIPIRKYGKQPKRPEMTPAEQKNYNTFIDFLTTLVEKYGKSVLEDDGVCTEKDNHACSDEKH